MPGLDKGSLLAIGGFALLAGGRALLIPLFGSADELFHIDYAYQLWRGDLPEFYAGPVLGSLADNTLPVQIVSQHPPLFYMLMAPIVGPLIDAGRPVVAGMAARALNILLGGLVVLQIARLAGAAWPSRSQVPRIAAVLVVCCCSLLGVSSAVYNDTLAALTATGTLSAAVFALRGGRPSVAWRRAALWSALGFLSRLSLIVIIAPCLTVVAVMSLRRRDDEKWERHRVRNALMWAASTVVLVLGSSGWFYMRNLKLAGSVTGGHPDWSAAHLGRVQVGVLELVTSPDAWLSLLSMYVPQIRYGLLGVLLLVVPVTTGVIAVLRSSRKAGASTEGAVLLMLSVVIVLDLGMQMKYSAGGGGLNPRYLLVVLPAVVPIMARGLIAWPRATNCLLLAWVLAWSLPMVVWWSEQASLPTGRYPTWPMTSMVLGSLGLMAVLLAVVLDQSQPRLQSAASDGRAGGKSEARCLDG